MDLSDDIVYSFQEESEAFFSEIDDVDLDCAIALSLQENCGAEIKRESDASFSKRNDGDLYHATSLSLQEKCAVELEKQSEVFLDTIDQDYDYAFALSLQELSEDAKEKPFPVSLPKSAHKSIGIVDEQWEVLDPNPDIHALFLQYNVQFFYGKLDGVEVKWSPRMTLCAGVCSYEGRGGLCSVRLSLPLLKLRPRRDLVETLLHEMIHAYLFVTANNKDHNAHGPEFLKHMHRINKETGTCISVYHSFHDEVDLYRKHIWRCNGSCQKKSPYYGYVKRAVNRAPGPNDVWWAQHQSSCGGTFTKCGEPEGYKKKSTKISQNDSVKRKPFKNADNQLTNIKKFLKNPSSSTAVSKNVSNFIKNRIESSQGKEENNLTGRNKSLNTLHGNSVPVLCSNESKNVAVFTGNGFLLGSSSGAVPKSFLANLRREIASSSSAAPKTISVQSEIASSGRKTFTQSSKNTVKESCVLGVIDSTQNNFEYKAKPVNKHGSQKITLNTSKKPSFIQSSIDKFVTSPSRPLMGNNNMNDATKDSNSNTTPKVKCPVCFKPFTSFEINAHLDSCLTL
ncbi:DNA-dependent metalloprotease dvc-1 isoform X1 [Parasteatoda tepidariorum]|uniref:DNA-dependent metalloprotease dvc-1 isoform X1 n=1 Tax=Parasteatoda tepidariorum TaxID=114398 RepID=UPI001C719A64|nr:DNA-dependent metalloprotease dvc-1 isoform X1 [Parasteatoda tepidariorum]